MTRDTPNIEIVPVTDGLPSVDAARLEALVEYALAASEVTGEWNVAVVLTSDEHLRQLHRDFLGIDEETDVMTFPDGDNRGGDVVISVERAAAQGAELGHTTGDEVDYLAVHGVLHLCGWDDDTPERRTRMLARQTEIIAAFDAEGG